MNDKTNHITVVGKCLLSCPLLDTKECCKNGLRSNSASDSVPLKAYVTIQYRHGSNSHETNQMSSMEENVQIFGRSCFLVRMLYNVLSLVHREILCLVSKV